MATPEHSYEYDVIIIGSGPGGYVCAIRCAQLGMKTAIIERYPKLGGTCLNVGCIPSKALLDSTEHFHKARTEFAEHGIEISAPKLNMPQMITRKQAVVDQTVGGVEFLMKKNKITVLQGHGSFKDAHTITVTPNKGADKKKAFEVSGQKIVIATGSKPASIPGVDIDKDRIITSTEALELKELPKKMLVIGGGIIGLEMGSVFARLGTEVEVIEYADSLIPTMDGGLGKEIQRVLKKHLSIAFSLQHKVQKATVKKGKTKASTKVVVEALDKNDKAVTFEGDYCLVAVGRKPYTDGLNLEAVGIATDERGRIPTDEHLHTGQGEIYAIGDVIKGAMLAHKASDEGVFLAEHLAGQKPHINYLLIPGVVYTWPEVASVGHTEEELKAAGTPYKVGNFPFKASGRARASNDTDGFIKILAHKETDEILGAHMIGPRAADLIAEIVTAMEYRGSAEDIGMFSHAHPTFSESTKEAALAAAHGKALHM